MFSFFSLGGLEFLKLASFSNSSLASSYDSLPQQDQKLTLVLRIVFCWISPLILMVQLKIYTLQYLCPERRGLPVKFEQHYYGQGKRNKQKKNVQAKTLLSISTIFSSSLWPFQNQDKDYFKWGVQNYKYHLVVLVVSFGENFCLKEVTHQFLCFPNDKNALTALPSSAALLAFCSIGFLLTTVASFCFRTGSSCETPTLSENRNQVPQKK